jgi:CIC family chloride channel protein
MAVFTADDAPLDLRLVSRTLLHAALVGLGAGLLGVGFFFGLEYAQFLILESAVGYQPLRASGEDVVMHGSTTEFRWWLLLFVPALGALAAGWLTRFAPEIAGGGGDAMIHAYHEREGAVRRRVITLKPLASILTLGTGGSGGREGPTMLMGAALGSLTGRLLKVSSREARVLMLAGVAAGIAAVFRTPLGAALLAVEVLYQDDFESEALIPAVLASVIAYSVSISLSGHSSLFGVLPTFEYHIGHLPLYALLALLLALLARLLIAALALVRRAVARIPGPAWTRPAYGGAALGVLAVAAIFLLGDLTGSVGHGLGILGGGYGAAQIAFTGASWLPVGWAAVQLLAILVVLKLVATAMTIGSGGSAGDFAPSMAIGGLAGGAFGLAAQIVLEDPTLQPGAFALIGMGAFYGSIAHVPLAALVLVSEMAGSYELTVPMMLSLGIALLALRRHTLYPAQPRARATSLNPPGGTLARLRVADVLDRTTSVARVERNTPAGELMRLAHVNADQDLFPVFDGDVLCGVIVVDDLRAVGADHSLETSQVAADLMRPPVTIVSHAPLQRAVELLLHHGVRELVVIDENDRMLGLLDEHDVSRAALRVAASTTADRSASSWTRPP